MQQNKARLSYWNLGMAFAKWTNLVNIHWLMAKLLSNADQSLLTVPLAVNEILYFTYRVGLTWNIEVIGHYYY